MLPIRPNALAITLLASTSLGCGGGTPRGAEEPITIDHAARTPLAEVVTASNRFTAEFYRTIATPHANQAASPHSVATAFAMLREGARGETRAELDRALHLQGDVAPAEGELAARIEAIAESGVELRTANRVFVEDAFPIEDGFRSALAVGFRAPFEAVSFSTDPEGARVRVNGWVAERTNDRIRELMPPGSVGADTRLVLTNAVYFHGPWAAPFDRARTTDQPFYVDGRDEARVPTMRDTRCVPFAHVEGASVGELPYAGDAVSMVVVVPDERDGLEGLLGSLDPDRLERLTRELSRRCDVEIAIPRFRIEPAESLDLRSAMNALGVRRAFDWEQADLSGITEAHHLVVGAAFHRAFVEVNEEGTEAAGATGVGVMLTSATYPEPPPARIVADHPFLFFLRDRESGLVLFVGHVVDPR